MILASCGFSQKHSGTEAVKEALSKAQSAVPNFRPSFLIMFASPTAYNQEEIVWALRQISPVPFIGSSSAGEITSWTGSLNRSIVILALLTDQIRFVPVFCQNLSTHPLQTGIMLAESLKKKGGNHPKLVLIFADGLGSNLSNVVSGIQKTLGKQTLIVGCASADDRLFRRTFQYINGQVLTNSVVGVGFYGQFQASIISASQWLSISLPRLITKAADNLLYELDSKPAIEIYQDYFNQDILSSNLPQSLTNLFLTYPLGLTDPALIQHEANNCFLVRTPLAMTKEGALVFNGHISAGKKAYLLISVPEKASKLWQQQLHRLFLTLQPQSPKAGLIFVGIEHKNLIIEKDRQEIQLLKSSFNQQFPFIGIYDYGEIISNKDYQQQAVFQNGNLTALLLAE